MLMFNHSDKSDSLPTRKKSLPGPTRLSQVIISSDAQFFTGPNNNTESKSSTTGQYQSLGTA